MIVAIKKNKSKNVLKIMIVLLVVFGIFYYNNYQETIRIDAQNQKIEEEKQEALKIAQEKKANEIEEAQRTILNEVEKSVSLVGQEHVKDLRLVKNKIVFICEPNTNIDALAVRYGAMALIKKTFDETVVVVDIDFILKNRL